MTAPSQDKPPLLPGESALALLGYAVCAASRPLHTLSLAVLGATFIAGVLGTGGGLILWLLFAAFMTAFAQAHFAWRLAFDQPVFAAWSRLPDDQSVQAQRAFDATLEWLLKKDIAAGQTRPMSARVLGAKRLHRLQIAALLGQELTLLVLLGCLLQAYSHA